MIHITIGILIKDQDITRLNIEWLRKKDGPCAKELSTEAEVKGEWQSRPREGKAEQNDGTAAPEMNPAQGQSTVKISWELVTVILTEDKRVAAWVFVLGLSHTWVWEWWAEVPAWKSIKWANEADING